MTIARQNEKSSPAFELKGSAVTLMVLSLFTVEAQRLNDELQALVATSAGFFRNAPLLIDAHALGAGSLELDLSALVAQLRLLGLVPVALRGGSPELQSLALSAGLGLLPALRSEGATREVPVVPTPVIVPSPVAAAEEVEETLPAELPPLAAVANGTKIVSRTIRSGQRIVAAHGDLIVLGAVNAGAEILAAGNIHVYGPLRGRALAGIHGDSSARICALQFHPELVAVAGEYLLHDECPAEQLGSSVVVTIVDEKLKIETIGAFVPNLV